MPEATTSSFEWRACLFCLRQLIPVLVDFLDGVGDGVNLCGHR